MEKKAHAADPKGRFKCAEIWDGLGRVGGCWSFVTGISSRANSSNVTGYRTFQKLPGPPLKKNGRKQLAGGQAEKEKAGMRS